jgi:SH3-like domain-containing protein
MEEHARIMPKAKTRKGRQQYVAGLAAALGLGLFAAVSGAAEVPPAPNAAALAPGFKKGRVTGYPLPRFVSLKSAHARMRVGPSTDYPTSWIYSTRGLPMEITEEYGNWRRVRDQDGASGWMFAPLLSGRRTAVVGPWLDTRQPLRKTPSASAPILAELDPAVRLNLVRCDGTWCRVTLQSGGLSGSIAQSALWGIYPGEMLD